MYRVTTAHDGTKTATCQRCGDTRGFRSDHLLAQWKRTHTHECARHRDGRTEGGAA